MTVLHLLPPSVPHFDCPRCHRVSFWPEYVALGYCDVCDDYTGIPPVWCCKAGAVAWPGECPWHPRDVHQAALAARQQAPRVDPGVHRIAMVVLVALAFVLAAMSGPGPWWLVIPAVGCSLGAIAMSERRHGLG